MTMQTAALDVGARARRRTALRLLPFVFLIYIVNYIDRVNVSFANLRMSADLGFSDKVYGFGVSAFYITYVLFEIPGAILVERWSARKWIARIMISWGAITIVTGFIHTAAQFYTARFFLGMAEAGFFPGMIVYLTHWFRQRERSRAIACLYTAVPTATLIGSPIAGVLLGVRWWELAGWRWLFILEGIPAIVLGVVTLFYLTDWPSQARWLPADERDWLVNELQAEIQAKKKIKDYTIFEAFRDRRVLLLILAWFLGLLGSLGNIYWIPTFVKRLSGFSDHSVTSLLIPSALLGIAVTLVNGWHSDKTSERRLHTAIPVLAAGAMYALLIPAHANVPLALVLLLVGSGVFYGFYAVFWTLPTQMLSETAAAATIGLINSMGQIGGFVGNNLIGVLNMRTHSLLPSFGLIAAVYFLSAFLILSLHIRNPLEPAQGHS